MLAGLARRFGSIFVLALAQRAEARSPYSTDPHATAAMAADERIHGEAVRGLAARGRRRLAGTFRAAVFGANDDLQVEPRPGARHRRDGRARLVVLFTGIAGLLAGALSMGGVPFGRAAANWAGAPAPDPTARDALGDLDIDAERACASSTARGMDQQDAAEQAALVIARVQAAERIHAPTDAIGTVDHDDEAIGTGLSAATSSSFLSPRVALIPVLPYLFGMSGLPAIVTATVLVSIALLLTGATVGLLSGRRRGAPCAVLRSASARPP